jgi:hypothetical protein
LAGVHGVVSAFGVFASLPLNCLLWQWFGEGEKYVKAVFSLASKISPSVIFVDEASLTETIQYFDYLLAQKGCISAKFFC